MRTFASSKRTIRGAVAAATLATFATVAVGCDPAGPGAGGVAARAKAEGGGGKDLVVDDEDLAGDDWPVPPELWQDGRDAGWVADNSFELEAQVGATLVVPREVLGAGDDDLTAEGQLIDPTTIEDDEDRRAELVTLQTKLRELIDKQFRYAKRGLREANDLMINQLVDEVIDYRITAGGFADGAFTAAAGGELLEVSYLARVDMIREKPHGTDALETPTLAVFTDRGWPLAYDDVRLPLDPYNVYRREGVGKACSSDYDSHSVSEKNLYYYFDPANDGCELRVDHETRELQLVEASVRIERIYPVAPSYPEYDRLLNDLTAAGFAGKRGFFAAIMPASDSGRFDNHRETLEGWELDLQGQPYKLERTDLGDLAVAIDDVDEASFVRYRMTDPGDAEVLIVVDLYKPKGDAGYRRRLGGAPYGADGKAVDSMRYQLVWYNGHSGYGTKQMLDHEQAYAQGFYQIIGMHSCRSYAYYSRQVLRAKPTADVDVFATGESSYPSGSLSSLRVLLPDLLAGLSALDRGVEADAPSWQQTIGEINDRIWHGQIYYGVAGARDNAWQPAQEID